MQKNKNATSVYRNTNVSFRVIVSGQRNYFNVVHSHQLSDMRIKEPSHSNALNNSDAVRMGQELDR